MNYYIYYKITLFCPANKIAVIWFAEAFNVRLKLLKDIHQTGNVIE